MYGTIYVITNIVNGKKYVRQTTWPLNTRWRCHVSCSKNLTHVTPICSAIRKYGEALFVIQSVASAENQVELDEKETFFAIQLCALVPDGYTLRTGRGRGITSEETRQKMSKSHKGSTHETSKEARKNISKALVKVCCKRGHIFDKVNTYISPRSRERRCLTCHYLRSNCKLPKHLCSYAKPEELERHIVKIKNRAKENRVKNSKSHMKTHCKNGHIFDSVNTHIDPKSGKRRCLTCCYLYHGQKLPERLRKYVEELT